MAQNPWRDEFKSLTADTTSGSQQICLSVSEIILKTIGETHDGDIGVAGLLNAIARTVERVKPAMAGLYTLAAGIIMSVEDAAGDPTLAHDLARKWVVDFRGKLLTSNEVIAQQVLRLLPERACIATCSNSGTILDALKAAKEAGKLRRVHLSESRPAYEGRLLAESLAMANIPVVLTADAALPGLLDECDLVLVGGDALCPSGLVNKAGTYPLALAAKRAGLPVIAALGSEKILPVNIPEPYLREEPGALWEASKLSINVVNRVFEYTPLELFDHIVTDERTTSGGDIPYIFARMKINQHLPEW